MPEIVEMMESARNPTRPDDYEPISRLDVNGYNKPSYNKKHAYEELEISLSASETNYIDDDLSDIESSLIFMRVKEEDDKLIDTSREGETLNDSPGNKQQSPKGYDGVISIVVPTIHKEWFEKSWLTDIYSKVTQCKGFKRRSVLLTTATAEHLQFIIILNFENQNTYYSWMNSDERQVMVKRLHDKNVFPEVLNAYGGGEKGQGNRIVLQTSIAHIDRPLPPPKWKVATIISLVTWLFVCINLVGGHGQQLAAAKNPTPPGVITFVALLHIVWVMIYAALPLVMKISFVKKWLGAPRPDVEDMSPLHRVLDRGLQMFALHSVKTDALAREMGSRFDKLEVKVNKLRLANHELKRSNRNYKKMMTTSSLSQGVSSDVSIENENNIGVVNDAVMDKIGMNQLNQNVIGFDKSLNMSVGHFVKWEHVLEFEDWCDRMEEEMSKHKGFRGFVRFAPVADGKPFVNTFSFDNYTNFNVFLLSEKRTELLVELETYLESPSIVQLEAERVYSDSWTELFVPTGSLIPARPPPMWKTFILTMIPLQVVVWKVGNELAPYLLKARVPIVIILLILPFINTLVNAYLGVPLMALIFGDWLNSPRPISKRKSCLDVLQFLDTGLPEWLQYMLLSVWFGLQILFGCLNNMATINAMGGRTAADN